MYIIFIYIYIAFVVFTYFCKFFVDVKVDGLGVWGRGSRERGVWGHGGVGVSGYLSHHIGQHSQLLPQDRSPSNNYDV